MVTFEYVHLLHKDRAKMTSRPVIEKHGGGPFFGGVQKIMKIDFLKSVLTFSPFSWVFRDRIGVVVSAVKRF